MTYKDMTFCTFYENCANAGPCRRKLTPIVREQAELWWGGSNPPIVHYLRKPGCFSKLNKDLND